MNVIENYNFNNRKRLLENQKIDLNENTLMTNLYSMIVELDRINNPSQEGQCLDSVHDWYHKQLLSNNINKLTQSRIHSPKKDNEATEKNLFPEETRENLDFDFVPTRDMNSTGDLGFRSTFQGFQSLNPDERNIQTAISRDSMALITKDRDEEGNNENLTGINLKD